MALSICLMLFVSLASATTDFPLLMPGTRPKSNDSYLCTSVRLSPEKTHYISGFKASSKHHAAHHMLVFGCNRPGSERAVWSCGEMNNGDEKASPVCEEQDAHILYAWAMDAPDLRLPEDVAFQVGGNTDTHYLVLQVHYADIGVIRDSDNSGVYLEISDQKKPKMAGVMLMGAAGYIPEHSTTFFETACTMDDEIRPFAFRVHTHALGKVVAGYRVQTDEFGDHQWQLIGKQDPQRPQMFYDVHDDNMVIRPGDIVAARCTMVNDKDDAVAIGATMKDEMCNFYLMYYLDNEHDDKPVSPSTCFSPGPPLWSWAGVDNGAGLTNIPDIDASTI